MGRIFYVSKKIINIFPSNYCQKHFGCISRHGMVLAAKQLAMK
jgi:hypothetical protein